MENKNTLADYKKAYEELSGVTSKIVRNLAFAGFAIIWIYKQGTPTDYHVPDELHLPTILLVLCLTADFLQYYAGTVIYFLYFRRHDSKDKDPDDELRAPVILTVPGWVSWHAKCVLLGAAYWLLLVFLMQQQQQP